MRLVTSFKKWRQENGFSQRDVADNLGCHVNTVINWDYKDQMNIAYAKKFKEIYEVDPIDLGFAIDDRVLKKTE